MFRSETDHLIQPHATGGVSVRKVLKQAEPLKSRRVRDPSNANAILVTGLWHSERMVLWQPRARD
jgi:hypothetical protein